MSEDKKEKKQKKKQGPIRTGAVIPFVIFTATTIAFTVFLLDSTLKKTFEFVGKLKNLISLMVKRVACIKCH